MKARQGTHMLPGTQVLITAALCRQMSRALSQTCYFTIAGNRHRRLHSEERPQLPDDEYQYWSDEKIPIAVGRDTHSTH